MAGHSHVSTDVSDAFSKRMAQVQEELQQMQRVQNKLKGSEQEMRKNIEPLQKELEHISKQIAAGYSKRDKLRQQLAACEEEVKGMEEKKAEICNRIYAATADVEQRRAELLSNAAHVGMLPQLEKHMHQAPETQAAPSVDLVSGGLDDLFSTPSVPAAAVAPGPSIEPPMLDIFAGGCPGGAMPAAVPQAPPQLDPNQLLQQTMMQQQQRQHMQQMQHQQQQQQMLQTPPAMMAAGGACGGGCCGGCGGCGVGWPPADPLVGGPCSGLACGAGPCLAGPCGGLACGVGPGMAGVAAPYAAAQPPPPPVPQQQAQPQNGPDAFDALLMGPLGR